MEFKEDPQEIGRISKVHGIKGGMVVETDFSIAELNAWPDWVFIHIDGALVPFQLLGNECFQNDDRQMVIFLKDIDRPEKCTEFLRQQLFVPQQMIKSSQKGHTNLFELEGYQISIEGERGSGKFIEFIDISKNPIVSIDWEGETILIPAREEFILDYDEEQKRISFNLPDGLLDLN